MHPHAAHAALAALAAERQGMFWQMHHRLFEHQDSLSDNDLVAHAEAVGLDVEQFLLDVRDSELHDRLVDDAESAAESGVRGTPTFFVGERRHVGPHDARTLIDRLEQDRGVDR